MRWFTQHDRASWCGRRKSNIQPRKSLSRYSNCVSLLWLEQQFHQKDSGEWEAEHRCDDDPVCSGGHGSRQRQRAPVQQAPCWVFVPGYGKLKVSPSDALPGLQEQL